MTETGTPRSIAVIGAGLAGLACSRALQTAGRTVVLFEKSRGVGGRIATRRADTPARPVSVDHGAQFFTARDPAFRALVRDWVEAGLAAPWAEAGADAFVGMPTMNAPLRHWAEGLTVRREHTVTALHPDGTGWRVGLAGGETPHFDAVALAVPAEQAATLLREPAPDFALVAERTSSAPCWTLMAIFDGRVNAPDVLRKTGAVDWAARASARPGRDAAPEAWVVHADADWSHAHLEQDREAMRRVLLEAFAAALGTTLPPLVWGAAHRWRYARSGRGAWHSLWDATRNLGLCGDWLIGPRVEAAFLSGSELGRRIAVG